MAICSCAIERLIYQYAAFMDAGDFDAVGGLFDSAALVYLPMGKPITGREKVAKHFRDHIIVFPETGTPCTMHQVSNVIIDIDHSGNFATANAMYNAWQCLPDEPPELLSMGKYADRFARRDGVWHFTERRVSPVYFGDLSRHLLGYEKWQMPLQQRVK